MSRKKLNVSVKFQKRTASFPIYKRKKGIVKYKPKGGMVNKGGTKFMTLFTYKTSLHEFCCFI